MTKGRCYYCDGLYGKAGMGRHLYSCDKRKAFLEAKHGEKESYYHVAVQGSPDYWMHLKVPQEADLDELDQFLRAVWVECCGHLSAFTIGGTTYSSYSDSEFEENGMDFPLCELVDVGLRFAYEYDFGTTTELILKTVGELEEVPKGESIQIMARNEAPRYQCSVCGDEATQICTQCIYDDAGLLCEQCALKHECGEDMLLPVVNSPRTGVCGYTGSGSLQDYSPA